MHKQLTKNFNSKEFDSPDEIFSGLKMDFQFVMELQRLRDLVNEPLKISSGYRTSSHNKKINGAVHSAHLSGNAADIVVSNSTLRYLIVTYALKIGFHRIGIGKNFVHLDNSKSSGSHVIWHYYK